MAGIDLEYATDTIWAAIDKPGYIGLRVDEGDSGVIYFTPDQAREVVRDLNALLTSLNQTEI